MVRVSCRQSRIASVLVTMFLLIATPAMAAMSADEDARALPTDDHYAKGRIAFEQEDWQGVIDHMTVAVKHRPWHDNAHSLMGFAHRKLGDFVRSLASY